MFIELRLYATLRRFVPEAHAGVLTVELPQASTVRDILNKFKINPQEVHMLMINGENSSLDQVLKQDDRVGLFPPVGGG